MADVTIVITAFNRERYIAEAVESALAQSVRDIEVLVVDDDSHDATAAIAGRIAARDARLRVVRNPHNLGDYPNRNHAARLVRTPFFKFHDSDDVMYPHCVQVMWSMLREVPDAAFALSASRVWPGGPCPMLLTPREAYQREFLGNGLFHPGPASALFRTDAFQRLGGFPEMGTGSDFLFWLSACRSVPVLLVPGDLFYWRQHEGQESQLPAHVEDQARAKGMAWRVLNDRSCPLSADECEVARRNFAYIAARGVYRRIRAGQWRNAWVYFRHSGLTAADWMRYLRRPRRSITAGTPTADARFPHAQ
jgi:glycosyltransferase involved in cell wall biosynthesis